MESDRIHAAGAIMRSAVDYDDAPGAEQGWLSWLRANGIPGIAGVDTRALVRHIRSAGAMRGGIFAADVPENEARERVDAEPSMVGRDLAREVTIAAPRVYAGEGDGSADRRARHRHQAVDHPQLHQPRRDAGDPPVHEHRRGAAGARPRRLLPRARPRRPRGARLHRREHPHAADDQAGVRHLPRPPAALARGGPGDVQAPVRPPRRQPPGQGPAHRPDRDHEPEPRLRGRGDARRDHRVRARRRAAHPREPLRRHDRGHPPARRARRLRPVPPRGGPRAERLASVSSTSSSRRSPPMPRRDDLEQDPRARLRPDRDRPGRRVRLLRRAGLQGPARGGLRGRARELQPGDDHDRPGVRDGDLRRAAAARPGRAR